MNDKTIAFLTALFSFLFWGALVIYWHTLREVDPIEVVSHRAIWSLAFTGIFVIILRKFSEVIRILKNPKYLFPLIFSSLLIAFNWGLFIWAVANEKIVESSMGNYITPLLNVAVAAIFFKVKMNKLQISSIILALIGVVYMILIYGKIPYTALLFAFSFCAYGIIKKLVPATAITGLFVETLVISIPSAIYILFVMSNNTSAIQHSDTFIKIMLILGGVVTTLPLLGFSYSAKILNLNTLGLLQYLTPTIAFLLGVFLYDEYFSLNMLVTFVFIWAGLIIYSFDGLYRLKKIK